MLGRKQKVKQNNEHLPCYSDKSDGFGTLNGGEAAALERLFTLHAALCDRFMLPNMEPVMRVTLNVCMCVRMYVSRFRFNVWNENFSMTDECNL